jgi:hypothetical protein
MERCSMYCGTLLKETKERRATVMKSTPSVFCTYSEFSEIWNQMDPVHTRSGNSDG